MSKSATPGPYHQELVAENRNATGERADHERATRGQGAIGRGAYGHTTSQGRVLDVNLSERDFRLSK